MWGGTGGRTENFAARRNSVGLRGGAGRRGRLRRTRLPPRRKIPGTVFHQSQICRRTWANVMTYRDSDEKSTPTKN